MTKIYITKIKKIFMEIFNINSFNRILWYKFCHNYAFDIEQLSIVWICINPIYEVYHHLIKL